MNALVLLSAMLVVAGSMAMTLGEYEERTEMDADAEDAQRLLEILSKSREPKDYHTSLKTPYGNLVSYLSSNDCGGSSDAVRIDSFTLSPDPLNLPGNVTLGFNWLTRAELDAPISADLRIQKKIAFIWFTVPCSMIPGGCHHDDICSSLAPITCPSDFETCHCPFKKGNFTLAPTTIPVKNGGIPGGDYRITVWLNQGNKELGCFYMQLGVS